MAKTRIAIIGGGASATLLLAHLALSSKSKDISVDVYDREARFGRGIAYSTTQECHLLNVRTTSVSAYQEKKDDFTNWASASGYGALDFVPRKFYGDYLFEKLHDAQEKMDVRLITADVKESRKTKDGYAINGETYDHAILASGNVRAIHVEGDGACSPWNLNYKALKELSHIALLGSGPSAVDAAISLLEHGYTGKATIISTHALLPRVHVAPYSYAPFLTESDKSLSPCNISRRVREEVARAGKDGVPWQAVIDALRDDTNVIWKNWSKDERKAFIRHLRSYWSAHRHGMAPEISAKLKTMNLEFVKARVEKIKGDKVFLHGGKTITADAIVNCLGYAYNEPDRVYEVSGKIGPASFGDVYETTAIPEIRMQAHQLAREILA